MEPPYSPERNCVLLQFLSGVNGRLAHLPRIVMKRTIV